MAGPGTAPPKSPYGDLARATRSAYPGAFDDYSDEELSQAVHKAYPGQFADYDDPSAGLELLGPGAGGLTPPTPPTPPTTAADRVGKRLGRKMTVADGPSAPLVEPPPTFLGSPRYQPWGGAISSSLRAAGMTGAAGILDVGSAALGRQVEISDPIHALGAGPRATYGYSKAVMQGLPANAAESAAEEALYGTVDWGTEAEDFLTPYAEAGAAGMEQLAGVKANPWSLADPLPVASWLRGSPLAVNMGVSALTDPVSYVSAGTAFTKFPRFLAGWIKGQNVIRSIEREGLERLATELPGVEARAAASLAEHPMNFSRFRGGPLYEQAARADGPTLPPVNPGAVAPPPNVIGPERQLPAPVIRTYPPGVEPPDPTLGSSAGDDLRRSFPPVGEPPVVAQSTYPPAPRGMDPTLDEFEDGLARQLETQPVGQGRLYGTPGYRLRPEPPPRVVGVDEGDDLPVPRRLWRDRGQPPPSGMGEGEPLLPSPEAPFPESRPGQGGLSVLREEPLPEGPFPKSYELGDNVFVRSNKAATARRLMPAVRRELERILDELDAAPYQANAWSPVSRDETGWTGNAGGGKWNVASGRGGAPVYHDILGFAPVQKAGQGGPTAKRFKVYQHIDRLLKTGKISSSVQEGAMRVAERRAVGDFSQLSRPTIEPWWGVPDNNLDDLGRTLGPDDVPFDIPEGALTPEDLAVGGRDLDAPIPRRQYDVDPRLGQAPLQDADAPPTPRYGWQDQAKRFFTEEEGSVPVPSRADYDAQVARLRTAGRTATQILDELGPPPRVVQQRFSGDVGDVQDLEIPTPQEDLPFSLTHEIAPGKQPKKGAPSLRDFFTDDKGEVDLDQLRAAMRPIAPQQVGKWLKQHRAAFKGEEWYQKATRLYNDGKALEAHGAVIRAQRDLARRAATTTAREIAGDRPQAKKTAAELRSEAKAVIDRDTPPWAHPGVKQERIVPRQYAKAVEQDPSLLANAPEVMRPPLVGPHPPPLEQTDLELGNRVVTNILRTATDAGILDDLAQPYSVQTGKPWRLDQKLRLFRQIADRILRSDYPDWKGSLAELRLLKDDKQIPLEQVVRWWTQKYSSAGRTLGELGNWQQARMKAGQITQDWIEPRFEGGVAQHGDDVIQTARQFGMSEDEIASLGQKRNALGRFVKEDEGAWTPGAPPEPATLMKDILWGKTGGGGRHAHGPAGEGTMNDVENLSRAILVSQPSTGLRNLWTGFGRYQIGAVNDVISSVAASMTGDTAAARKYWLQAKRMLQAPYVTSGVVPKKPWLASLEDVFQFNAKLLTDAKGNPLKIRDARRSLSVMQRFSERQDVKESIALTFMGNAGTGEAETVVTKRGPVWWQKALSERTRNRISTANRFQEFTIRSTVFDAAFRSELDRLGFDTNKLLTEDFADIVVEVGPERLEDALKKATYLALDYTFAAGAYPGSPADQLLGIMSRHWFLRTGYPFPKFNWVTAPRAIYDHSPLALLELPMTAAYYMRKNAKVPHGRLAKGLAAANLRDHALPKLATQKRVLEAGREVAWLEYRQRQLQARGLAKEFRILERRSARTGNQAVLPGGLTTEQRLTDIGEQLGALEEATIRGREKIASASHDLTDNLRTSRQLRSTIDKATAASMPDFNQYIARMTTGAGILGAAWVVRSSPGAEGTNWYEYRTKLPEAMGGRTVNLDFRAFPGFAQALFVADVFEDLRTHTDWDLYHSILDNTDPENDRDYDARNPLDMYQALRQSYDGTRDMGSFGQEFAEAFLSISRAAGATLSLVDLISDRETRKGKLQDYSEYLIGSVGQFLGRFTTPGRTLNDLDSLINPEADVARIPEETASGYLVGPTIANIPRLRERIPPKISATTGEPLSTMYPALRTLTGVTIRVRRPLEVEMKKLGLQFSDATPRQTGDRRLDNKIASAYAKVLNEILPDIMRDPDINAYPIAAKRGIYKAVFSGLKAAAYADVQDELSAGLDEAGAEAVANQLARPGELRLRQYWLRLLRRMAEEESGPTPDEPGVTPPPTFEDDESEPTDGEDDIPRLPDGI